MSAISDDPADSTVLDREAEQEKSHDPSSPRIRSRSAAGHPAKKTDGLVTADMSGIHSTREEFAPPVFTNGFRHSASRAVGGRCMRTGMRGHRIGSARN